MISGLVKISKVPTVFLVPLKLLECLALLFIVQSKKKNHIFCVKHMSQYTETSNIITTSVFFGDRRIFFSFLLIKKKFLVLKKIVFFIFQ